MEAPPEAALLQWDPNPGAGVLLPFLPTQDKVPPAQGVASSVQGTPGTVRSRGEGGPTTLLGTKHPGARAGTPSGGGAPRAGAPPPGSQGQPRGRAGCSRGPCPRLGGAEHPLPALPASSCGDSFFFFFF